MSDIENKDFEYYLKESKKFLFDYENHDDALNSLNKAIELNPKSSEAISLRGRCQLEMLLLWGAISDFQELIESNSANRQDFISYFISQGLRFSMVPVLDPSNENGIKCILKAIELDISKEDAYLIIPALKKIIKRIDENIIKNPENKKDYFLRGSAKYALGRSHDLIDTDENAKRNYQIAIKDFDKVIELNFEPEVALLRRGICRCRSGLLKDSIKDFDKVILLKPDSAEAHAYKGMVQCDSKGWEAMAISKAKEKGREAISILKIIKRIKDANANLKKAIDLDTNFSYLKKLIEKNEIFLSRFNDINEHVF